MNRFGSVRGGAASRLRKVNVLGALRVDDPRLHATSKLIVRHVAERGVDGERRREWVAGEKLLQYPHSGTKFRHHVPGAVHGDEGETMVVVGDVTGELRTGVDDAEVGAVRQGFLLKKGRRDGGGVVKVRSLRSAGKLVESELDDRGSRALV